MLSLHTLADNLLSLLFPDQCAGCQRLGSLFCSACQALLRPYPPDSRPFPFIDAASVAFVFAGPLRDAIHRLKYERVRRIAGPLGALLATHLRAQPFPAAALIPVPLHPKRQAERGFNQSEELARHLSRAQRLPLLTDSLVRVRDTAKQSQQANARARQENVRDSFVWQAATAPPARILLVDDVLTTGATLSACAQALKAAGAQQIYAIALARSRPDG